MTLAGYHFMEIKNHILDASIPVTLSWLIAVRCLDDHPSYKHFTLPSLQLKQ